MKEYKVNKNFIRQAIVATKNGKSYFYEGKVARTRKLLFSNSSKTAYSFVRRDIAETTIDKIKEANPNFFDSFSIVQIIQDFDGVIREDFGTILYSALLDTKTNSVLVYGEENAYEPLVRHILIKQFIKDKTITKENMSDFIEQTEKEANHYSHNAHFLASFGETKKIKQQYFNKVAKTLYEDGSSWAIPEEYFPLVDKYIKDYLHPIFTQKPNEITTTSKIKTTIMEEYKELAEHTKKD